MTVREIEVFTITGSSELFLYLVAGYSIRLDTLENALPVCAIKRLFFLLTSFYITLNGPVTQLNDPFNKHDKILIRAYYRI